VKAETIERVFGRERIKMATGDHVEVFRESVAPGERRRYTKRFLETGDADFRQWTVREWRILARLIGHGVRCVPDVVQYHGGAEGGVRQLQTYDAGVSVDQWATLLPVSRGGTIFRHVYEDCAHWWALAHHCLAALEEIHALHVVHLDLKADNICIPFGPPAFDPESPDDRLHVMFERLALIDFAFSLVSRDNLTTPLPIGWEKDYDYQSPRLLNALEAGRAGDLVPTQELDWRCDLYSLAAMLRRYLCDDEASERVAKGWTPKRRADARALIYRLRDCHDGEFTQWRPHRELLEVTGAHVVAPDVMESLACGWMLVRDREIAGVTSWVTPLTRVVVAPASPTRLTFIRVPTTIVSTTAPAVLRHSRPLVRTSIVPDVEALAAPPTRSSARFALVASAAMAFAAISAPTFLGDSSMVPTFAPTKERVAEGTRAQADVSTKEVVPNSPPTPDSTDVNAAQSASSNRETGEPKVDTGSNAIASYPPTEPKAKDQESAAASPSPSPSPASLAQRSSAASLVSRAARRSNQEVVAKAQAPHSAPSAAAKLARSAPSASPAPARARTPTTVQIAKAPRAAPVSYDPVAARNATAYLTMLATRVATPAPSATDASLSISSTPAQTPAGTGVAATDAARNSQAPATAESAANTTASSNVGVPPATASSGASDTRGSAASASSNTDKAPSGQTASDRRRAPTTVPDAASSNTVVAAPADALRAGVTSLLSMLGLTTQRAAPIEERNPRPKRSIVASAGPSADPAHGAAPTSKPRASNSTRPEADTAPVPPQPIPSPAPQMTVEPRVLAPTRPDSDLSLQAKRMLAEAVPRVAAQARADASQVLWMAAAADHPLQQRYLIDASRARWRSEQAYPPALDGGRARHLHDAAAQVYASGRKVDALDLEQRAFAVDPRDPDIAGFLAFLYLHQSPPQPEAARQLALHALAFSGIRRSIRFEDWNTFAVASALTGRDADAAQAFLVELTLSGDAERTCRAALHAYSVFGERLRGPVDTLLYRIRSGPEPRACASVPVWTEARS
jgi:serine/threonine protein kinase